MHTGIFIMFDHIMRSKTHWGGNDDSRKNTENTSKSSQEVHSGLNERKL